MDLIESLADPGLILFFSLPGFMLLKGYGYEAKNGYDHLMMSLFWGTIWFLFMGVAIIIMAEVFGYDALEKTETESLYIFAFVSALMAWPSGRFHKFLEDRPLLIFGARKKKQKAGKPKPKKGSSPT